MNANSLEPASVQGSAQLPARSDKVAGKPLVSVIISNYNHGKYLEQSLAGILRQTYRSFELVITDDGSTDGSQSIIKRFAARDQRIKPHFFPKNRGAMAATENNMAQITGNLLYGGAADDFIIDERFFEKAVNALERHPDAAGFYGVAGIYSADENRLVGAMGSAAAEGFNTPEVFIMGFLKGLTFVPGNSSIWRLDALKGLGGFDYSLGPQIDFWINHALPLKHGVVFGNTPVSCQRSYESNTNYGSKGSLWEATERLAKIEASLRLIAPAYEGMDADWVKWRARWTIDAIRKTGASVN